jgi:hypothetical protein
VTRFTPSRVKPAVGQSVTITCVASGRPEPSYTIFHNGTKVSTSKTYIIPEVQWSDAGTYICNATNKLGNGLESLTLIVVGKIVLN